MFNSHLKLKQNYKIEQKGCKHKINTKAPHEKETYFLPM